MFKSPSSSKIIPIYENNIFFVNIRMHIMYVGVCILKSYFEMEIGWGMKMGSVQTSSGLFAITNTWNEWCMPIACKNSNTPRGLANCESHGRDVFAFTEKLALIFSQKYLLSLSLFRALSAICIFSTDKQQYPNYLIKFIIFFCDFKSYKIWKN